jgi:hypothetical protein
LFWEQALAEEWLLQLLLLQKLLLLLVKVALNPSWLLCNVAVAVLL